MVWGKVVIGCLVIVIGFCCGWGCCGFVLVDWYFRECDYYDEYEYIVGY